jgi:hypothetical protein
MAILVVVSRITVVVERPEACFDSNCEIIPAWYDDRADLQRGRQTAGRQIVNRGRSVDIVCFSS